MNKPLIRWAGGKTRLSNFIIDIMMKLNLKNMNYHELFCGGCAIGIKLMNHPDLIKSFAFCDANEELINFYESCKTGEILEYFHLIKYYTESPEMYYKMRNFDREEMRYHSIPQSFRAFRFLYLNSLCFNGLYRVNSSGYFNVPMDKSKFNRGLEILKNKQESIIDFNQNVLSQNVNYFTGDFFHYVETKNLGNQDLMYLDPPYHTQFTNYTADKWDFNDFLCLVDTVKHLNKQGVKIVISYDDFPGIRELFPDAFTFHEVQVQRSISRNGDDRKKVGEVVITNF